VTPELEKIRSMRDMAKILRDNETYSSQRHAKVGEQSLSDHHRGRASAFDFVVSDLTRYLTEKGIQ
jgi:hypothetical protein